MCVCVCIDLLNHVRYSLCNWMFEFLKYLKTNFFREITQSLKPIDFRQINASNCSIVDFELWFDGKLLKVCETQHTTKKYSTCQISVKSRKKISKNNRFDEKICRLTFLLSMHIVFFFLGQRFIQNSTRQFTIPLPLDSAICLSKSSFSISFTV